MRSAGKRAAEGAVGAKKRPSESGEKVIEGDPLEVDVRKRTTYRPGFKNWAEVKEKLYEGKGEGKKGGPKGNRPGSKKGKGGGGGAEEGR